MNAYFISVLFHFNSSDIIWEQCKIGARRYKKIDAQKVVLFEDQFQQYVLEKMTNDVVEPVRMIDEKTEVWLFFIIIKLVLHIDAEHVYRAEICCL